MGGYALPFRKAENMIKFVYMINRVKGMSFDAFVDYHRSNHAPLFTSIPEAKQYVRKYTVSHPVAAVNYPAPAYDGLTEIGSAVGLIMMRSSRRRTTCRR